VRPGAIEVWRHSVQLPACLSVGFGVVIVDDTVLPLARPSQYPLFQLLVEYQYATTGAAPRAVILPLDAALCCLNLLEPGQTFSELPLRRQAEVGNIMRKAICRLRRKLATVDLHIGTVAGHDKRIIGYILLPAESDQMGAPGQGQVPAPTGPSLVPARGRSVRRSVPAPQWERPITRLHAR
jgi:hypothetical protein